MYTCCKRQIKYQRRYTGIQSMHNPTVARREYCRERCVPRYFLPMGRRFSLACTAKSRVGLRRGCITLDASAPSYLTHVIRRTPIPAGRACETWFFRGGAVGSLAVPIPPLTLSVVLSGSRKRLIAVVHPERLVGDKYCESTKCRRRRTS